VAYVRIKQFQEHTHQELVNAAVRLRAAAASAGGPGLTGVLLDLRSDPGGLVDQAAEVADEFLVGGTIYTTRHRGEIVDEVRARPGGAFSTLPVVVLVDEWSASASELVAGALQDQKRALLVGANTFGKGSVQSILPLPGGAGLRLTTARYYTPNGRSLQAAGVRPDVILETPDPNVLQLHERDLEGHLAAETSGASPSGPRADAKKAIVLHAPKENAAPAPLDPSIVEGAEAMMVPVDPSKGRDFALRVGYQVLRGTPVPVGTAAAAPARAP
jgi:carboxyl-terminal processing protease